MKVSMYVHEGFLFLFLFLFFFFLLFVVCCCCCCFLFFFVVFVCFFFYDSPNIHFTCKFTTFITHFVTSLLFICFEIIQEGHPTTTTTTRFVPSIVTAVHKGQSSGNLCNESVVEPSSKL